MNWALAQVLPDGRLGRQRVLGARRALPRRGPLSYFGTPPAGGLGWGLPAAIGLKLARPERTVISAVGDGAYLFANPAACHHAMAMHDLPVLTVDLRQPQVDRGPGLRARHVPGRPRGGRRAALPAGRLGPAVAYEMYAAASGGYGEAVTERAATWCPRSAGRCTRSRPSTVRPC